MKRFLSLFLVSSLILCLSCTDDELNHGQVYLDENSETLSDPADLVINNFTTDFLDIGIKKWELRALKARMYHDEHKIVVEKLILETYDKHSNITSSIVGDWGVIYSETKNIELISNVVITASNGTVLTGVKFFWNNSIETISSELPSTIIQKNGDKTYAKNGLRADKNVEEITLFSVKGNASTNENDSN